MFSSQASSMSLKEACDDIDRGSLAQRKPETPETNEIDRHKGPSLRHGANLTANAPRPEH